MTSLPLEEVRSLDYGFGWAPTIFEIYERKIMHSYSASQQFRRPETLIFREAVA